MRYKDFYVRITPDKYIPRVDKIDNFSAAVGFEILENSLAEAKQLAKDYIDCEGKFIDLKS